MTARTVLTAGKARADLYRLIDQTAESHHPVVIIGKRNSAVLISGDDWKAIQERLNVRQPLQDGIAEPLAS